MAIKQMLVCDRCGQECKYDTIHVKLDSEPDPSGHGYEDITEPLDLCCGCLRNAAELLLGNLPLSEKRLWIKNLRTPKVVRV